MDLLKDKIRPMYLRYLVAATGSALVYSVFGIVDAAMIGNYHGPVGNAALAVFSPIWAVGYCLGLLSGVGGAVLFGNHGAAQFGRVRECLRCGIWTSFGLGTAAALLVFLLPKPLVRLFTAPTAELLAVSPGILRVHGLSFLFLPFNIFAAFYFQSILKERIALAGSVARGVVLSGALVLLLPAVFGPGSIFWAMPVSEMTVCALLLLYLRKQRFSVTGEEQNTGDDRT